MDVDALAVLETCCWNAKLPLEGSFALWGPTWRWLQQASALVKRGHM